MATRQTFDESNVYKSFSDVALMMLGMFVFLLVTIMITARMSEQREIPQLRQQLAAAQAQLQADKSAKKRMAKDIQDIVEDDTPDSVLKKILEQSSLGRRDFDLFIKGLEAIPGHDVHLIVDATGSMHGASPFLIPILRVIFARSGKRLDAITWYSDYQAQTYVGSMGEMFDQLMKGAPFSGSLETIGKAFEIAEQNAPPPAAYILIGDEPSNDTIRYSKIPAPVFAMSLSRTDTDTIEDFQKTAQETGGKMLEMEFK